MKNSAKLLIPIFSSFLFNESKEIAFETHSIRPQFGPVHIISYGKNICKKGQYQRLEVQIRKKKVSELARG